VVTEVGATLRELSDGGRPVIDGFGADEVCGGGRGQLLLPWPNRIRDGAYELGGRRRQLALSEPQLHNAIHGLVRWSNWRLLDRSDHRVRLGITLHPQPGYPGLLELTAGYSLAAGGLRLEVGAVNRGTEPAPFGCGSHPYLKPAAEVVDGGRLRVPARSYLELDERLIPTGRRLPVEGTRFDFRRPRPLGDTRLDTCFADLEEPVVEFDARRVEWDDSFAYVQLFTGDTLAPEQRRRGLAVEPMSCPADAFNSGEGLVMLQPGDSWTGAWTIWASAGSGTR
jgi:aldose 1-epimerase